MKASELSAMTKEQLEEQVKELKSELFGLRFQLATGQLQNTMRLGEVKKDIAREALRLAAHKLPLKTKLITKASEAAKAAAPKAEKPAEVTANEAGGEEA